MKCIYNGMSIYKYKSSSDAVYIIRENLVYLIKNCESPALEIVDDIIYTYTTKHPAFKIKGYEIYPYGLEGTRPVYEIKPKF